MRRTGLAVTVLGAMAVGLAAGPAAADMAAWKKIAATFGTYLPKLLPGWKHTKLITNVSNSAFQKHIVARRVYRTIKSEGVDTQINIAIEGSPGWKKKSWTYPCIADRTSKKCTKFELKTIGGRKYLIEKRRENLNYRTHVDGGRIAVLFAGKWAKPEHIEPYLGRIDYAKLKGVR
ncbi:MAG: hypothetical protein OEQ29_14735 [Alphaproteobacteria bacterium]|nr:hypothetical protein [Alphaproteobacteria bacterium]